MILISVAAEFGFLSFSPLPNSSSEVSERGSNRNSATSNALIMKLPYLVCYLNLQPQPVLCFHGLARPQRSRFGGEIDVVPLRIEMSQYEFCRLTRARDTHRVRQLEMLLNRFVSPERTFHQ